ncbi:tRNA (guanosine(46)-N7)-methyltransferase TrmB [Paenibacillus chartarius]|uniref:tRNA (guanine-N(7)-)-methyltransferase n=1 Tax=Paenibacillus chartarius TaxID=747481 RepID=A0ABV6DPD8_9BACL
MRLRGRRGTREELEQRTDLVVLDPKAYKGRWHERFGNNNPIHVELGMGKGQFITQLSAQNPDINYIGIDMFDQLLHRASDKAIKARIEHGRPELNNLAIVLFNIEYLEDVFADNELERVYLNFSDPWPKKRHHRRRLTHPNFLRKYMRMLNSNGDIHFKTDSEELFEFSLNSFSDVGLRMRNITLSLHREGNPSFNVMTEYEGKFVEQGKPIYRCEVVVGADALAKHVEALKTETSK